MSDKHDAGDPIGHVNPESVKLGHEPDEFRLSPILSVPLTVLIFFAATYTTVSLVFRFYVTPTAKVAQDPANAKFPLAAKDYDKPLNERLGKIDLTNGEVKQPRLEGLRKLDIEDEKDTPVYERSFLPKPTSEGNSPEFHPEDVRPDSAYARSLGLQSFGWADKGKEVARIPIAQAMKAVVADGSLKAVAKDKQVATGPDVTWRRPKASNAGRGVPGEAK